MVDQLSDFADSRLIAGCIYCGGLDDTRDHVPSRVLLDLPFPENLPIVPACRRCNTEFSSDEEYLACLIEAVLAGTTDPDRIERSRVAATLRRKPGLRARIQSGRRVTGDQIAFDFEYARVRNVVLKLARGHAAFELSALNRSEPTAIAWWPMPLMSPEERDSYNASHVVRTLGEVGSRGMQRLLVVQATVKRPTGESCIVDVLVNDWVDVQEGRYRYLAIDDQGEVRVKIVIREYLACEVVWSD